LVLVTGAWAQEYSLAASTADFHLVMRSAGNEKITPVKYDRLERLGARSGQCSELANEYNSV
jgi:hypothetical protein